jgi:hypothetical protein
MPLPRTQEELEVLGYKFAGRSKCLGRDCGQIIAWFTTPQGKRMPFDEGTYEVHWFTCPNSKDFKKGSAR